MTSPGSKYFLDVQSNNAIYRDQSYLATFGAWNRFKVQFRYDEIPHTYTNTARTLYTQTARGSAHHPLAHPEHSAGPGGDQLRCPARFRTSWCRG